MRGSPAAHREAPTTTPSARSAAPHRGGSTLAHGLLSLQRGAGNRAVAGMLERSGPARPGPVAVQRKAGDVTRADFELMVETGAFLNATDRNMGTLYGPLKERFRDAAAFKSADLRKLAIRFQTTTLPKLLEDKKANKGAYTAAGDLVRAVVAEFELDRKQEAETMEEAGGGHSLDRHGPEITDVALQARLTTGIAPDGAISVAPGYSSKFASYTLWLDTRQRAIDALVAAVATTQIRLMALEPRLPTAQQRETAADQAVTDATAVRQAKHVAHERAKGQLGVGSVGQLAARDELDQAAAGLAKATTKRADLASSLTALLDALPLPVDRAAVDLGDITSFRVKKAYRIIVDNAKTIGTGWQGTGVQAPRDVVHGGRTVEDAVLYAGTQASDTLTKSLTTLDGGAAQGTPLLTAGAGGGAAVPNAALTVGAWGVVQHFPAPPDAVAGIE